MFFLLASIATAGCATSPSEIFRTFKLNDGDSVATGARERIVTNHRPSFPERYGQIVPQVVVCTEPSPDVAGSIANSFGFGVSVFGQGSGSLSGAQIESLLQLSERTVSTQLLRDQMYRACEAYSNGAINATNYTLIMSRLNETMITLMLGETAGGAFGRSLGTLGGKANSNAFANLSGMVGIISDIDQAAAKLATAEKKVLDATSAYVAAKQKVDDKKCIDDDGTCTAERKDLETYRDNAKVTLDQATGQRDAIKELMKVSVDTAAKSSAESASVLAGGGISSKPDEKVAKVLARMQKEFVRRDPGQSLIEACLVELSTGRGISAGGAAETILEIGVAGAQQDGRLLPSNATAALVGARQTYRSGLYEFCVANLSSFADKARETRFALLSQEIELDSKELLLRDVEARAKAAEAFADSLVKCNGIQNETVKADCLRTVGVLKDKSSGGGQKSAVQTMGPVAASLASPTQTYDIAKTESEKLAATFDAMPAIAANIRAGKDTEENRKLKLQFEEKRKNLDDKKSKLDKSFSAVNRSDLRAQEGTHTDKRSAFSIAKDDKVRELALAEFRVEDVKLVQAAEKLTLLANAFDSTRHQYEALKIGVNKFNIDQR
ncbi:hypothetical protein B0B52_14895 [Polaromonas sp. A23]|nr:hypothetical protein B0B52_14895 [Polaromonas sp. A23]